MKTKLPYTKDELKAAKRVVALWRKERAKRWRAKHPVARIRDVSPVVRAFDTWHHDLRVLIPAVARETPSAHAREIASRAAAAADRMSEVVKEREPRASRERERGGYRMRSRSRWQEWQERFDALVHALSDESSLGAERVIARAAAVADEAQKLIDKRRPRGS